MCQYANVPICQFICKFEDLREVSQRTQRIHREHKAITLCSLCILCVLSRPKIAVQVR